MKELRQKLQAISRGICVQLRLIDETYTLVEKEGDLPELYEEIRQLDNHVGDVLVRIQKIKTQLAVPARFE